jgi:hypothetical protein
MIMMMSNLLTLFAMNPDTGTGEAFKERKTRDRKEYRLAED